MLTRSLRVSCFVFCCICGPSFFAQTSRPQTLRQDWERRGPAVGAQMGPVSAAGDVNGDGYEDVIIGASRTTIDFPEEGCVQLFLGGPDGLASERAWMHLGGRAHARFGSSLDGGMDINGDGYDDFVVGSPAYGDTQTGRPAGQGRAYMFMGGPDGVVLGCMYLPREPGTLLGASVALIGDVDGNGLADLAIGEPGPGVSGASVGRVLISTSYRPTYDSSGFHSKLERPTVMEGAALGWDVSGAGDVNGDGFADVLLTRGHVAELYRGSKRGLRTRPAWTRLLPGYHGGQATGAGDLNGDGFDDIVTAGYIVECGFIEVYFGSPRGPSPVADWRRSVPDFEGTVTGAGDLNDDGFDDLYVGGVNKYTREGHARLFPGSSTGIQQDPAWSLSDQDLGWQGYTLFGIHGAGAGDVDGDGFDELLVGAPWWSEAGLPEQGAAFCYTWAAYTLGGPIQR